MTKKLIFSLIAGLFLTTAGYSQVYLGFRAGANYSNITNIHPDSEPRIGFQGGVLALIPLSKYEDKLYLQPEINYSNQGEYTKLERINSDTENESGEKVKNKIFLNYINVPVQVKYYFQEFERGFYVSGGPYVGFMVGENIDGRIPNTTTDEDDPTYGDKYIVDPEWDFNPNPSADPDDDSSRYPSDYPAYPNGFSTIDYGVLAGVGYSLSKNFEISARYAYGLNEVIKGYSSSKNSVFNLGIKYVFDTNSLKGKGTCYF